MKSEIKEFFRSGKHGGVILLAVTVSVLLIVFGGGEKEKETVKGAEDELREVCSMVEGVGECRVMITYKDNEVYAVAVICEGAGDPKTEMRIVDLITSLYGIGSNRVSVKPLSKKE